jgi:hypothetical protein
MRPNCGRFRFCSESAELLKENNKFIFKFSLILRKSKKYYTFSTHIVKDSFLLKGPKHEIFESGFLTEIRPVRIGDLGTGEKK